MRILNVFECMYLLGVSVKCYIHMYSKTCLKRSLKKKTKIGFQDRLSINAGQKYCRMLQGPLIKLPSKDLLLSYHLPLRALFCLFLSGRLRRFYCIIPSCLGICS